ncbi:hypothetical protein [Streptomyces sp. NPDC000410]|uniref:hypothetical protein n=1 Tax=Streptomyces sp. NPDC000410 TaxID=3154254 RepID=UPI003332C268
MGTDIDCAIETRGADGCWEVEVGVLGFNLRRDYEAWNCLFNVRGVEHLRRRLFADRGLPDDVSDPVRETGVGDFQHGHTYATWADVAAVDWDAPLDDEPAWYWVGQWRRDDGGELVLEDVVRAPHDVYEAACDTFGGHRLLAPPEWPPGGEVLLDGIVYRPVFLTARMLAPPDEEPWSQVWGTMRELATEYGDENVRLVVWFG